MSFILISAGSDGAVSFGSRVPSGFLVVGTVVSKTNKEKFLTYCVEDMRSGHCIREVRDAPSYSDALTALVDFKIKLLQQRVII